MAWRWVGAGSCSCKLQLLLACVCVCELCVFMCVCLFVSVHPVVITQSGAAASHDCCTQHKSSLRTFTTHSVNTQSRGPALLSWTSPPAASTHTPPATSCARVRGSGGWGRFPVLGCMLAGVTDRARLERPFSLYCFDRPDTHEVSINPTPHCAQTCTYINTAHDIASHGRVVIMSLHQPSPDMFDSLNQVSASWGKRNINT